MNRYDWSKLDDGWRFEPESSSVRADALVHTTERGTEKHFAITELELEPPPAPHLMFHTRYWKILWQIAKQQLAKCRIRDTEPAPPKCNHEWNDTRTVCVNCRKTVGDLQMEQETTRATVEHLAFAVYDAPSPPEDGRHPSAAAAVEIAERVGREVAQWTNEAIAHSQVPDPRDFPVGPFLRFHGLPWKLGPLAAWTLVNIAAHDGRLTVVMKRGRGELIDETGPDDDALWERLGKKVVDYEKAKAKAAAEAADATISAISEFWKAKAK
jgi:hypothetical protein